MTDHDEPVTREVTIAASPERAFEAFVDELGEWWPAAFTFAGDALDRIAVVPGPNGRLFERARDGSEADWGEIRAWEPPRRLAFAWRVAPDRGQEPPERASEVDVRFEPAASGTTRVRVRHRDFARHGDGADAMRAGMASPQGWSGLLDAYRRHAERA